MSNATTKAAFEILSQCVAGRTHKLARTIDRIYNEELRTVGLRNTQLTTLAVLAYMSDATVSDLAAVLVMEKSTLSRNLKIMQKQGWVAAGTSTGRRRGLVLTPAGKTKLRAARTAWRRAQARARDLLPQGAVEQLRGIGDAVGLIPDRPQ